MKLKAEAPTGANTFTGYGEGFVMVNQQRYERSLVVTPDLIWTEWGASTFEALAESHFEALLPLESDVLILGTGNRLRFPHPRLTRALAAARKGLEVMDVPAACRTYNLLASEGRMVAAALLLA